MLIFGDVEGSAKILPHSGQKCATINLFMPGNLLDKDHPDI